MKIYARTGIFLKEKINKQLKDHDPVLYRVNICHGNGNIFSIPFQKYF